MQQYLYSNYVAKLAERFDKALSEIEVVHSFDYGPEFEVAICKVLRRILPQKFGVCRGFIVDASGEPAGDDIIIFDRIRFPTLRALDQEDYAIKEHVPVDAVYAYLEAKHTLDLEGSGNTSLIHACEQAAKVKALCAHRTPVALQTISPNINLGSALRVDVERGWPKYRNPMLTGVISRRVRTKAGVVNDAAEIHSLLASVRFPVDPAPDLVVAGRSNIMIPGCMDESTGEFIFSGFYLKGESTLYRYKAPEIAFGVGLCCLLCAIDWIQLERMPWQKIIADGLGKTVARPDGT